jgi:hypothetical protein
MKDAMSMSPTSLTMLPVSHPLPAISVVAEKRPRKKRSLWRVSEGDSLERSKKGVWAPGGSRHHGLGSPPLSTSREMAWDKGAFPPARNCVQMSRTILRDLLFT